MNHPVADYSATDIEARRLTVQAIATLANLKRATIEFILKPAGVPPEVYEPLFKRRDPDSNRWLSKREVAPLILDGLDRAGNSREVINKIIRISAAWNHFDLAADEFAARATVQKARELLGQLELMDAREAKQRELARQEDVSRITRARAVEFEQESQLLLSMFDQLAVSAEPQRRGYLLQELLNRLFDLNGIPVTSAFVRNAGGEQIDGAFRLDGWQYIVECRWRTQLANIRELDGLGGQIGRSGKQTMGVFLSINGWSTNVPGLLKQNASKDMILMDGYDLRTCLNQVVDLSALLLAKVTHLNLRAEPFLAVSEYLSRPN